jgi:hypothetical protein
MEEVAMIDDSEIEEDLKIFRMAAEGTINKGGPGSGNFGHKGRPGAIGGSGKGAGYRRSGYIPEHSETLPSEFAQSNVEEIPMPDEFYGNEYEDTIWYKQCFFRAFKYVLANTHLEGVLVHGVCKLNTRLDYTFDHGWVEFPEYNAVFDGVTQRFYDMDSYYKELKAIKVIEYDDIDAMMFGLRTGNSGPWTELGGDF